MANNGTIFDRLVGLETEYAIRFHPTDANAPRPPKYLLFRAGFALRRQLLTVEAKHFKDGVFTATGGAVWFETERPMSDGGLIEGSTPECRGPRQVLAYQRCARSFACRRRASRRRGRRVRIAQERSRRLRQCLWRKKPMKRHWLPVGDWPPGAPG